MEIPDIINENMKVFFLSNYIEGDEDSLQSVLIELKNSGYSQMQSLFLLVERLSLSFVKANQVIVNSKAWN